MHGAIRGSWSDLRFCPTGTRGRILCLILTNVGKGLLFPEESVSFVNESVVVASGTGNSPRFPIIVLTSLGRRKLRDSQSFTPLIASSFRLSTSLKLLGLCFLESGLSFRLWFVAVVVILLPTGLVGEKRTSASFVGELLTPL
jgi:hypothetical protein